ncbi:hypothetical protein OH76DRAFT_1408484 [Lentinus brumalis]|uniref:Uncharacterized protein n=1 Tax=Lentinus brumalis TaxID=2498619 RepID=A0A371CXP4_9APHY|nr:hypothetical protein OH76DRAFT_1408484 [Polyporus brumalis]
MTEGSPENSSSKNPSPRYVTVDAGSRNDSETLQQHSPSFTSKLSKTWHRFYPVIPFVYVGHIWFRRRMPRVLPRFTTLKLWELYASWGLSSALTTETRHIQTQWIRDRDLATIQVGAFVIWQRNHRDLRVIQELKYPRGTPQRLDFYPQRKDGVLAEFIWWYNHMWSSEQTWRGVAHMLSMHLDGMKQRGWDMHGAKDREDWNRIITFLANAIHGKNGGTNYNMAFPVAQALVCLTPIAMLARHIWARTMPVLWFNGLQRTLCYGAVYLRAVQEYQFYRYSADIEQKQKVAELLCRVLPGLDSEVDELIRVSLSEHV